MKWEGKAGAAVLVATVLSTAISLEAGAQQKANTAAAASLAASTWTKQTEAAKAQGASHTQLAAQASQQKTNSTSSETSSLVPSIIKQVSPSVVGIIGKPTEESLEEAGSGDAGSGDEDAMAHGTGVVLRSDGWIITNAHVVLGLEDALVVTSTGKQYSIEESYIDEVSDLALIRIQAKDLKPAKLAASSKNTVVGERVIALGTPVSFSLRGSATEGIVSGLNRAINASYRLIQTDAAINPGNSGGPLLNMKGEVIGINSMKYEAIGVENMGFSIPIDTVHYVINQLLTYGEVRRPSLGLTLKESHSAMIGLPSAQPLTVTEVNSDAAKRAGIQAGDVLYRLNNTRVSSLVDVNELLKKYKPGDKVVLWMQSEGDIVKRMLQLTQDTTSDEAEALG